MKRPEDVNDLIDMVYKLLYAIKEKTSQYNYDELAGEILARATEPDEKFKRDELVRIFTQVERSKEMITYLHCPVKDEGMLQRKHDGNVYLNDTIIPEGSKIEYMLNGDWAIGVIKKNPKALGINIANSNGEIVVETINQVTARVR